MPGLLGRNLRVDDGARPAPLDPCIRLAHAGSDQRKAKYTHVTQAAQKYECRERQQHTPPLTTTAWQKLRAVPTPPRGGTLPYLLKSTTTHVHPCSNTRPTIAPPHEQAPAHGTNSAARWHLPFQELSTHVLPCTNPRPLALLRTNKPSRAEWVAAVHHISVLMGPTRSLIAALSTPPTHLPPSVALSCLAAFLGNSNKV